VGFFQTQEVFDFLNYLRFLVSPADDTALAGVLRSPFFALDDPELYAISLWRGESFWEKLGGASGAPDARASVRRARELLESHRSLADRIPVPRLLRRIASDTGWIGVMAGLAHGPQRRENFLKLLELSRRRGSAGPFSLYDFTSYLDHRAGEEEREGQASTAATGAAVRVMTVHAAKGLEFPVVALPFLDRAQRPEGEPIVDTEFGIGFRVGREKEQPPLYGCLRALSEEKRLAEEKRIFYVACTRARDVLLLSGNEGMKQGTAAPLGWLREAAAAAGVAERDSRLDFGEVAVRALDPAGGAQIHHDLRVPLSISVRRGTVGATGDGGAPGVPAPGVSPPRVLTGPISDLSGGESYSATMLKTYLDCPARYYLTYVLGIGAGTPDERIDDVYADGGGASDGFAPVVAPAGLEGEITHRALSALTPSDDDRDVASRVEAAVAAFPAAAGVPGLRDRIATTVDAFARSTAGREILSRPRARTEYQVSASFGDAVVMGTIDRLFEGADGLVEFVDYKTDAVSADGAAARAAAHRHQIALYAFLISRLFAQRTVRATLLFLKAGPTGVPFDFGGGEFDAIERSIRDAIASIRAGAFSPPAVACRECPGGRGQCPVIPPAL
jgi:ATP-dependent helicase/nuclease subunit A